MTLAPPRDGYVRMVCMYLYFDHCDDTSSCSALILPCVLHKPIQEHLCCIDLYLCESIKLKRVREETDTGTREGEEEGDSEKK